MNTSWSLFLVAGVMRLAAAWWRAGAPIESDELLYDELARNVLQYHAFVLDGFTDQPTALVMPLYPTLIAAIYAVVGRSWQAVRVVQAIIGAGTAVLLARVGSRVGGQRTGRVAGWLFACHPMFIMVTTQLTMETVFTALLVLALERMMCLTTTWRRRDGVLAGVSLGLLTLCRPEAALLPCCWLGPAIYHARQRRAAVRSCVTVLMVIAGCLAPWTIRNAIVLGRFMPLSTLGGLHFWDGVTGGSFEYDVAPQDSDPVTYLYVELSDAQLYRDTAAAFWTRPGRTAWLMGQHLGPLYATPYGLILVGREVAVKATVSAAWRCWRDPGQALRLVQPLLTGPTVWWRIWLYVVQYALLVCAVVGVWMARDTMRMYLLWWGLGYFTLVYALMPAVPRYNVVLVALCMPLAAHGGCWLLARWRRGGA